MSSFNVKPKDNWIVILLSFQCILLALLVINLYFIAPGKVEKPRTISAQKMEEGQILLEESRPNENTSSPAEVPKPIHVEVLNGCGVKGLASKTADFLRGKGYDVRDFKNAAHDRYQHTTILVRGGNRAAGEMLAALISLPLEMVIVQPDSSLIDIDVTLLLGKDYRQYILPQ
jgi:hypothetical protein